MCMHVCIVCACTQECVCLCALIACVCIVCMCVFAHTLLIRRGGGVEGRLYSVDWTRDWTRDWTVGLDSQKVALIILKHQNTTTYLHDMNGIRGSRP